ncbi:hypothetical protein SR42_00485 [Clostridium botulinum]|uniref:hypothetical protein n=1 Tax=Clostridium botulinum TaxID=1491 RepID=UPI000597E35E|nr:hypothetical protein [Clostridium botulinum]KIL07560.1 hypothetical protein SR42_00485 [Clostridium botulinum]MBY6935446.1 hypothetical protein [Clostridium botulinum]NFL82244.1 hypothetical protein [Clostridium botulinum]NFN12609.1 hypothetical protein [Clostridium botulinum]NFO37775.1 hypothetical protein [Clostridium botulinum]
MKKVYKLEQLEALKTKYSKEMLKEAEEIIRLLDENYSENRELEDMGGYIAILESKEDVAEIKANSIKGLLQEYTDIIKSDEGIDYYSSLFLLSDDYWIVVFSTKELHEILIEKEL